MSIPPGRGLALSLLRLACRIFGDEVARRTFEPLIADWQHEWRNRRRGLRRLRSALAGGCAFAATALLTATPMAMPWQVEPDERRRILRALFAFTAIGTVILLTPFVKYVGPDHRLLLLILLVPSSLPIALAFALLPALLRFAAGATPARRARVRMHAIGVVGIAVVLISLCVGWLAPVANQEWRRAISGRPVPPGLREVTAPQLWSANAQRFGDSAVARERRTRASLALGWPVTLAFVGWRLGRWGGRATARRLIAGWLGAAMFVVVMDPLRTLGADVPWLAAPLFWLLAAVAIRPRDRAPAA